MALLLEQQENNRSEKSDFLLAQMYERQQAESIKYLLLKGKRSILMISNKKNFLNMIFFCFFSENSGTNQNTDEYFSTETSSNFQSDFEYAAELEHEWLKVSNKKKLYEFFFFIFFNKNSSKNME